MTSTLYNWKVLAHLWLLLMPGVLTVSGIGVWIYSIFGKDLKIMEDMVSSNPRLHALVVPVPSTLRGRWLFVAAYSGVLIFADVFIRRGQLLPEDIAGVPESLRKRLWWGQMLMSAGLAWMGVIWVVNTFIE